MYKQGMTTEEYVKGLSLRQWINMYGTIEAPADSYECMDCGEIHIQDDQPSKCRVCDNKDSFFKHNEGDRMPFRLWRKQEEFCDFCEIHKRVISPKSRQKGFSEMSAERAIKTLLGKKNGKVVVISASEDKARDYKNDRFLPKYEHLLKNAAFPVPKIVKNTEKEIRLENGSKLLILPASKIGAAGITADGLVFDEAGGADESRGATAENSHFKQLLRNSLPAMDRRPKSWMMIIGTSVPGTYYNELVRQSWNEVYNKENQKWPYRPFFIGCFDEPGRDQAWYDEKKMELQEDIYLQQPRDINDFFHVKDGLVIKDFDRDRHTGKFELNPDWEYYVLYDHGTIHPAACVYLAYDPIADHVYVFKCDYFGPWGHETPVSAIANKIRTTVYHLKRPIRAWVADNDIFKKRGVDSVAKVFANNGIKDWKAATKHDEEGSLALLKERFRQCSITIDEDEADDLIIELQTWRYKVKGANTTPQDRNNDAIDALKYGLAYLKKKRPKKPPMPRVPYEDVPARKNVSRFGERHFETTRGDASKNYQAM
jgi:hypothetical protein